MSGLSLIDVNFDVSSDTPLGRDPDSCSPTLREYHRLLWSKPLPDGTPFTLTAAGRSAYLLHESARGRFALSSDTVANEHVHRLSCLYAQMPDEANDEFYHTGYTIGGTVLFPGEQVDGKQTINQRRGTHPKIQDRFDLTLECIRRHYMHETSPLDDTLARYADFFALFESFAGYIGHFLLQDLIAEGGRVQFFLPFDDFGNNPLPSTLEDYRIYRDRQLDFVAARNARIARYVRTH